VTAGNRIFGKARSGTVAALDVGSTKICCFIAHVGGAAPSGSSSGIRIAGIGHQVANGIRSGTVIDMDAAEACIRRAVDDAEKMAGERVGKVFVNISGGYPASHRVPVEVAVGGQAVDERDMRRLLGQWQRVDTGEDRQLIHSIPVGFSLDGDRGIRDPRGLVGGKLGTDMHVVTAASATMRNLTNAVRRCHLEIEGFVVSPFASGLASLVEDEMDLGVTVIDMGGGTTTLSVFFDGSSVFADCVPVGGGHVTNDIARGLATPVAEAERLKTLHGSALTSALDDRDMIEVPLIGEENAGTRNQQPKSFLVRIIQPRLEETFELVRTRLRESGYDKLAGQRVVITGGASQMPGIADMAQRILEKQIRLGRPIRIHGLADTAPGPAFSTCAGLLAYAVDPGLDAPRVGGAVANEPAGMFGRVGSWFRENF